MSSDYVGGEPIPESLARKYEKFFNDVRALTGTESEAHTLTILQRWSGIVKAQDSVSADQVNKNSEAVHNARHLNRLYELLGVTHYDEAVDRIADLKKTSVDPTEISDLRARASSATRDVHNLIELLGADSIQDAHTRIYALLRLEKEHKPAEPASSS